MPHGTLAATGIAPGWGDIAKANLASAPFLLRLLWHDRTYTGTLEIEDCRGGLAEFARWGNVAGALVGTACSNHPTGHLFSNGPIPC